MSILKIIIEYLRLLNWLLDNMIFQILILVIFHIIISEEVTKEKSKYKAIAAELDLTFADLSGY